MSVVVVAKLTYLPKWSLNKSEVSHDDISQIYALPCEVLNSFTSLSFSKSFILQKINLSLGKFITAYVQAVLSSTSTGCFVTKAKKVRDTGLYVCQAVPA